jgi:2-oxoglutarate ferredoxin oxidoreductase subunit alpha
MNRHGERTSLTVRVGGDSGDGIAFLGFHLSQLAARHAPSLCAVPDFPAEIRAEVGTLAGVQGYQIRWGEAVACPGTSCDILLAMHPAAWKVYGNDLRPGGCLIVPRERFTQTECLKAGLAQGPTEDAAWGEYAGLDVPLATLTRTAVAPLKLSRAESDRCQRFFILGLLAWLCGFSLEFTQQWLQTTFARKPEIREGTQRALLAGFAYGQSNGGEPLAGSVRRASSGNYRLLAGSEAVELGLIAVAKRTTLPVLFCTAAAPPTAGLLQRMSQSDCPELQVFQAEDDSAALGAALGAAFGGTLGISASTGPGLSLQSELLGLACMVELPVVVLHVQHAGPATGMPTKPEQADLATALHGRTGESPVVVLACGQAIEGFEVMQEAVRLAVAAMTPVIVLTDVHILSRVESWRIPEEDALPPLGPLPRGAAPWGAPPTEPEAPLAPYQREGNAARPWLVPGLPGGEHCLSGLEKVDISGAIGFDPVGHESQVRQRAARIEQLAEQIAPLEVFGPPSGELLLVGWGSTFGPLREAAFRLQTRGMAVGHAHFRHLHPVPTNTSAVLRSYRRVLVAEMNQGQWANHLRAKFGLSMESLTKVQGVPFGVEEILAAVLREEASAGDIKI